MITTNKDLMDRLFLFPPDAKIEFLTQGGPLEILSVYSEGCSFVDGEPVNTEGAEVVCIDLGAPEAEG